FIQFLIVHQRPPRCTRFPYTTLFRSDPHRRLVRVFARDFTVHIKQVAVALADHVDSEPLDGIGEVEVHRTAGGPHAVPLVADGLDRKSTRLNSSHVKISYAVCCWKKK